MLVPAGKVLNYAGVSQLTPAEISARAAKILRFIDLGGHERYMKTALYGMTCMVRWQADSQGLSPECKHWLCPPPQIRSNDCFSTSCRLPTLGGTVFTVPCSCLATAWHAFVMCRSCASLNSNPARGA